MSMTSVKLTIVLIDSDVGRVNRVTVDLDLDGPSCGTVSWSFYAHSSDVA